MSYLKPSKKLVLVLITFTLMIKANKEDDVALARI